MPVYGEFSHTSAFNSEPLNHPIDSNANTHFDKGLPCRDYMSVVRQAVRLPGATVRRTHPRDCHQAGNVSVLMGPADQSLAWADGTDKTTTNDESDRDHDQWNAV